MNVVVFGAIYRSSEYNRQSMEENRQRRIYGISGRVPVIGRRTEHFLISRLSFVIFSISKQHLILCWPRSIGRRAIWWVTAKAIKDALPIFINSSRHFLFFSFLFGRGGLGDLCFHLGCQLLPEQGAPVGRKSISVESDFVMDRQDLPPAKSGSPWAGSAFCRHFLCQCDAVEEKVSGLRFFLGGRQTSSLSIDPLMRQHGRVQIKRRQRGKRLKIQRRRHCRWRCSF